MIVTVAGLGTLAGAAYKPLVEIVPCAASPPVTPLTCHVTAVFVAFETVAVNCCALPAITFAVVGVTETETAAVMVSVADADLAVSAWETALTVMLAGFGTLAGAA